jgi:hypothetical protein
LGEENVRFHGLGSQKASQYRMVSVGAHCGLLDRQRKEVFPPDYNRIYVLSDTLFAVRTDSGYYLINHRGRRLLDLSAYDDVQLPEPGNQHWTNFLLVKRAFRWGVVDYKGKSVLPLQYARVFPQRDCPTCFVVMREPGGLMGMVDEHNKQVFPCQYTDLMALDAQTFARRDRDGWYIVDRNDRQILKDFYQNVHRLNRHLYEVTQDNGIAIFSIHSKKLVSLMNVNFRYKPVDEDYVVKSRQDTIPVNVMDLAGKFLRINGQEVLSMQPATMGYYRVSMKATPFKRYWGLWKPGLDTLSTPCIYTSIHSFHDSLAIVELDGKKGLINLALKEILPPAFRSVRRENQFVKAENDSALLVFKLMPDGLLSTADIHGNVQTIRIAAVDSVRELNRAELRKRIIVEEGNGKKKKLFTEWINGYAWVMDSQTGLVRLMGPDSLKPLYEAEYAIVLPKLSLALVFSKGQTTLNAYTQFAIREEQTPLCRMAVFDYCAGKFITGFDFLGLRYSDFLEGNSTAAFVDLEGNMGLMDWNGTQITKSDGTPFRCAYIDEFNNGHARFCRDGRLDTASDEDSNTTWELPPFNALYGFTQPGKEPASYRYRLYHVVSPGDSLQQPKWGVLDFIGREVVPPRYDYIQTLNRNGVIARSGSNWGVLGFKGDTILDFKYRWISDYQTHWKIIVRNPAEFYFSVPSGVAVVDTLLPKVTGSRKTIGKNTFDRVWPFSGNRAAAQINGQACLLDKQGNYQYLPNGCRVLGWSGGFSAVDTMSKPLEKNRKLHCIYLNAEGVDEFGSTWTEAKPFRFGLGMVKKGYFWGAVNNFGLFVTSPKYVLMELRDGGIHVRVPSTMGLADKKGRIVVPPEYDRIEILEGGYFRVERGGAVGYRRWDGGWVWERRE